jgi:hypothetical protein
VTWPAERLAALLARWTALGEAFSGAEGRELAALSAELRQVEAAIGDARIEVDRAEADASIEQGADPVEVARVLLRELPALARTDVELARSVRDELCRVLPPRDTDGLLR